ncbi:hypothetical protein B5862_003731 [Salmonella enterica subsp. enterica serovar Hvittingfoss]|nr:hypothetical protein [Salmonella enterica subsp. enterica serovar Hvittingfoss]
MAHWVLKQWPQLALDAISQITFQMDNKHSSYPVCIGFVKPDVDHLRNKELFKVTLCSITIV